MNQKWKTLIISLLTPSSIISGIALIVLWGYFSRLGRLDIFFDVMNIKSILGIGLLCNYTIIGYDSIYLFYNLFFYTRSYSSGYK
ncbi:hypothetical protein MS6204_05142 [Escherichia coli]|nr:hypothetical protein [Escherichia coli]NUV26168.1 hypothetical protein [Escherichia coli]